MRVHSRKAEFMNLFSTIGYGAWGMGRRAWSVEHGARAWSRGYGEN